MNLDKGGGSTRGPRSPGGAHAKGCGKLLLDAFTTAVLLFLIGMVLLACSHAPTEGVVVNKQHYASYTYVEQACAAYNKYGACTAPYFIPIVEPEVWKLCLRDDAADTPTTGCREVNQGTYESVHIGDWYKAS